MNNLKRNNSKNISIDNNNKFNAIDYINKNNKHEISLKIKEKDDNSENESSDTDRDTPMNDEPIKNLIKCKNILLIN